MKKILKKAILLTVLSALIVLSGCAARQANSLQSTAISEIIDNMNGENAVTQSAPVEYRAVWISYLEWENTDTSTLQSFTAAVTEMFDNAAATGFNTVIVQVRPFGDAMYKSDIFPYSHLLTGTQGQDPGYDPLSVMVQLAHERGLRIEAWVNPYRVQLTASKPAQLAENNPAVLYLNSSENARCVLEANGGLYYNPASETAQKLIEDGAAEIAENYAVDGIIFDDYFYPEGIDESFDAEEYSLCSQDVSLQDWRRENVNSLIRRVYSRIKSCNPEITFSVSPQGNNDNNYNVQYSDIGLWLSQPGYIDALIPQIYWGYNFVLSNQSDRFSFANCAAEWANMPRRDGVKLYIALGAFRIGAGDGSCLQSGEWQSGANLSEMVKTIRAAGCEGFSVYRYDNLYRNTEYTALAQAEEEALRQLLGE